MRIIPDMAVDLLFLKREHTTKSAAETRNCRTPWNCEGPARSEDVPAGPAEDPLVLGGLTLLRGLSPAQCMVLAQAFEQVNIKKTG